MSYELHTSNPAHLNAEGEPCTTAEELRAFIHELHAQGGAATDDDGQPVGMTATDRDSLLTDVNAIFGPPA